MLLTFLAVQRGDPFGFDLVGALPPALGLAILIGVVIHSRRAGMPRLFAAATAFLQMTLFTLLGVILAYAIAAGAGPLWDARLAVADRALGLDWPAIRRLLDASPLLVWPLGLAYHSLILQMVVVIIALSEARRFAALQQAVCAAILSGFVTVLLSGLMPALGNLFEPGAYRHLWPSVAWMEKGIVTGLRDGSLRVIDLCAMMGIVSSPSYHATLAAIFIWAFGQLPRLRVAGSAWAVLTIVATPVFGGHYGVDVIAGLLLAPPAVAAARLLVRLPRQRPMPVRALGGSKGAVACYSEQVPPRLEAAAQQCSRAA